MSVLGSPTAQVLKNRGVPVKVHVLARNEAGRWARTFDAADEPVLDTVWVQMTNDVLAAIEDPHTGWGSMDAWQKALSESPFDALCRTFAICLDWWHVPGAAGGSEVPDKVRAGKAMLDGERDAYTSAVGGAFMLANGLDPQRAGDQMAAGVRTASAARDQQMALIAEELDRANAEAETQLAAVTGPATPTPPSSGTPGADGSPNGAKPVAELTSSGG